MGASPRPVPDRAVPSQETVNAATARATGRTVAWFRDVGIVGFFWSLFATFTVSKHIVSGRTAKWRRLDRPESELRNDLMRFRAMEAEATDPVAVHFLHDIVVVFEAEPDRRYHQS